MKLGKDGFVFTKEELKAFEIQNPTIYSILCLAKEQSIINSHDLASLEKRVSCALCLPVAVASKYRNDATYYVCNGRWCGYELKNGRPINDGGSCVAARWKDIINGIKKGDLNFGEKIDDTPITLKYSIKPV